MVFSRSGPNLTLHAVSAVAVEANSVRIVPTGHHGHLFSIGGARCSLPRPAAAHAAPSSRPAALSPHLPDRRRSAPALRSERWERHARCALCPHVLRRSGTGVGAYPIHCCRTPRAQDSGRKVRCLNPLLCKHGNIYLASKHGELLVVVTSPLYG